MIGIPVGTKIWIAAGTTDMRRGFTGLSAIAKTRFSKIPSPDTSSSSVANAVI